MQFVDVASFTCIPVVLYNTPNVSWTSVFFVIQRLMYGILGGGASVHSFIMQCASSYSILTHIGDFSSKKMREGANRDFQKLRMVCICTWMCGVFTLHVHV